MLLNFSTHPTMTITPAFPRLDLGEKGWKLPSAPEWLFGSEDNALRHAKDNALSPEGLHLKDTRPTIREVMKQITAAENRACGIDSKWSTGPWDEYFSACTEAGNRSDNERWPDHYRWMKVYVVTGGSEGLYLHVDVTTEKETRRLLLGKTCSCNREAWEACYASAMRIAWLLQA